jgi:hypothetical protein
MSGRRSTASQSGRYFLCAKAVVLAIEAMHRLPFVYRRQSEINDLKWMLNEVDPGELALLQADAHRLVEALLSTSSAAPFKDHKS